MILFRRLVLFVVWLGAVVPLQAQHYDTPPFNFDRSMDEVYVDSLLRATRLRLLSLNRLPPSPTVDTARMEYLHFTAYVHYSGMAHRDSALLVANQLVHLAERRKNTKYQIKGLLLTERYYRASRIDYPKAIKLNYRLLTLTESNEQALALYFWRIYRNLGSISISIGQYDEAVGYLKKSLVWFDKDRKIDPIHLADLHRILADAYKRQQHFDEAEAHYLTSLQLVNRGNASVSNKAYVTNDVGRLYNLRKKPALAIPYLNQSVAYWGQLNSPLPQADALADLAESYLELGQYDLAIAHAKRALDQNQKVYATMLTACAVLTKAYEKQQDWKNAWYYQQRYDTRKQEEQQAVNQAESLRIKALFDRERLETAHQHDRILQEQRYRTVVKQAEIDRLYSDYKQQEMRQLAQTTELTHLLETQQLNVAADQKQTAHQTTIKQLNINQLSARLNAQQRLRNQLFVGLAIIGSLGLLLVYYSLKLKRTNRTLRTKNREIESALIKGQTIERRRVAVELHDRVSSLLGATKMTFQTIDAETLSPRDKKLFENTLYLLNDAATQVRQLSHNLIPEQLLQQDLIVALRDLVEKLNLTNKTSFSLSYDPSNTFPLPQKARFNLYVICLELCTNILRHAQARHATIEVIRQGYWLSIVLTDDGVGLMHSSERGMGLQNIDARAQSIGAQFRLEPAGGSGTSAYIRLPLSR